MILSPEVAFTGDTTSDFMLDPCNADALRAKILITEVQYNLLMKWVQLFHLPSSADFEN